MGKKLASLFMVVFVAALVLVPGSFTPVRAADCPHLNWCIQWPSFHLPNLCCPKVEAPKPQVATETKCPKWHWPTFCPKAAPPGGTGQ